jgi:DNA processing protein
MASLVDLSPAERVLVASLCPGTSAGSLVETLCRLPNDADASVWVSPPGLAPRAAAAWFEFVTSGAWRGAHDTERRALDQVDARAVTPLDADWPDGVEARGVLRVRGTLPAGPRLAVVGTRKVDRYGRDVAQRVTDAAAARGVPVVSGGALGVDAIAHARALERGLATVVVLGSGLSHPAPSSHRGLFDRAAACGAVVSAYPCGVHPAAWTFPARNAWIAALSAGTIVVQAGADSGALHTAAAARALGRPVWAVPGTIDSPLHVGCHRLVSQGAALLEAPDAWAASAAFSAARVDKSTGARSIPPSSPTGDGREPLTGLGLWRAAGAEPTPLAVLAAEAGLGIAEAASVALMLELDGFLVASPGGRYARSRPTD